MQRQKYMGHCKLGLETLYVWLHPNPSPVSGTCARYIFILDVVPIYTIHYIKQENKDLFVVIVVVLIIYHLILV